MIIFVYIFGVLSLKKKNSQVINFFKKLHQLVYQLVFRAKESVSQ